VWNCGGGGENCWGKLKTHISSELMQHDLCLFACRLISNGERCDFNRGLEVLFMKYWMNFR
jgi:hypothetical protein